MVGLYLRTWVWTVTVSYIHFLFVNETFCTMSVCVWACATLETGGHRKKHNYVISRITVYLFP